MKSRIGGMSCEQESWFQKVKQVFLGGVKPEVSVQENDATTSVEQIVYPSNSFRSMTAKDFGSYIDRLETSQEIGGASVIRTLMNVTETLRAERSSVVMLDSTVPTIVVPDIHADQEYVANFLDYQLDGQRVIDLLEQGKVNVVCLGDGIHSENPDHWKGDYRQELVRSVNTMQMIMALKSRFSDHFHYLRGNHDDIMNDELIKGDIKQSQILRDQMRQQFSGGLVDSWHQFETQLPVLALLKRADGSAVFFSHTAPGEVINPSDVEHKPVTEWVMNALTWVDNVLVNRGKNHYKEEAVIYRNIVDSALAFGLRPDLVRWVIGHRHIPNDTMARIQCDGQLIQIADPYRQLIYPIPVTGDLHPRRDVVSLTS